MAVPLAVLIADMPRDTGHRIVTLAVEISASVTDVNLLDTCLRIVPLSKLREAGTMAKECPDRPTGKPMACYRCGGDHVKSECPHPADVRCTDCGGNRVSGVGLCHSTNTGPRRPRQPAHTDDKVQKKQSAADFVHTKTTAELEASGDADTFYSQETRDLVDRINGLFSSDSSGGSAPAAQEDGQDDTWPEEQNSSTVDNFSNVPAGGSTSGASMMYDDDIQW